MAKKQPKVEYGITITRPWSKEMYDHNEELGDKLRVELMQTLDRVVELNDETELRKFSKAICYHGFGEGYSYNDIVNETRLDIETLPNFQMNEDLDWYINNGYIQQPEKRFIGYGK
jgi:hypothetical protein